jgi:hypothetical protein
LATDQGPAHAPQGWIKVAAVVVSGLAINWLSDLFAPTVAVVLVVAIAGLVLLALSDSPRSAFNPLFLQNFAYKDSLKFALASLLLGSLIGALWNLPIFRTHRYSPNFLSDVGAAVSK